MDAAARKLLAVGVIDLSAGSGLKRLQVGEVEVLSQGIDRHYGSEYTGLHETGGGIEGTVGVGHSLDDGIIRTIGFHHIEIGCRLVLAFHLDVQVIF